jgi:hypothetical protein
MSARLEHVGLWVSRFLQFTGGARLVRDPQGNRVEIAAE